MYPAELPRIVIVDDDPVSCQIIAGLLEDGFQVRTANSGKLAVEICCQEPQPDLILLDILMPGMNGYEVCSTLKALEQTRDIPIIFLSSKDEESDEVKGFELGAVDYVSKPIFPQILLARVKTHIALNHARQRLRGIADNLLEGIALVSRGERLLFVNKPAIQIMGLELPPQDLVGKRHECLFQLKKLTLASPPWQAIIVSSLSSYIDDDAIFISPGGREVPVSYGCSPLVSSELGRVAIITFRDITAVKRTRFEAMLSARQAVVGQLAEGLAHEINTPAQYISANLEYLQSVIKEFSNKCFAAVTNNTNEPAACAFEGGDSTIHNIIYEMPDAVADSIIGIKRINAIVSAMKEFAQLGTADRHTTDINLTIKNALDVTRSKWAPNAEVKLNLDSSLPAIDCYASEISQVLINLILNAAYSINASDKLCPGLICISTRRIEEQIEIEVVDNGQGIPEKIRDQIFDPFFTTKPVGMGIGLGLAICHDIVTVKHSGSISVGGADEEGAIFTIRLPLSHKKDKIQQVPLPEQGI
jgi:signal transduction histidine kinase/DNA-binding response OmpR family regulator